MKKTALMFACSIMTGLLACCSTYAAQTDNNPQSMMEDQTAIQWNCENGNRAVLTCGQQIFPQEGSVCIDLGCTPHTFSEELAKISLKLRLANMIKITDEGEIVRQAPTREVLAKASSGCITVGEYSSSDLTIYLGVLGIQKKYYDIVCNFIAKQISNVIKHINGDILLFSSESMTIAEARDCFGDVDEFDEDEESILVQRFYFSANNRDIIQHMLRQIKIKIFEFGLKHNKKA